MLKNLIAASQRNLLFTARHRVQVHVDCGFQVVELAECLWAEMDVRTVVSLKVKNAGEMRLARTASLPKFLPDRV